MSNQSVSRRSFFTSTLAAASAFQIVKPELVRGAGNEKLKAGLVGCGSRGTTAVQNVLTGCDNVEIVALADVFEDRLEDCLRKSKALDPKMADRVKVDAEHRFVGFDSYKKLIASDVDIVMLATYPAYRPIHFEAAVEAKKHVFCEKPFGTDPVNLRRFMAAAKKSEELHLTVKSGAQRRCAGLVSGSVQADEERRHRRDRTSQRQLAGRSRAELQQSAFPQSQARPEVGRYGVPASQLVLLRVGIRRPDCGAAPPQHRRVQLVYGDASDGSGGVRQRRVAAARGGYGNIYDHLSADFVYANGVHMSSACRQYQGRNMAGNVSERIVGTKGTIDTAALRGVKLPIDPYVQEHIDMVNSILGKGPYLNESMAVAESTMTCLMGREAAYSGQKITWEMMMNSQQDLLPKSFDYKDRVPVPTAAHSGTVAIRVKTQGRITGPDALARPAHIYRSVTIVAYQPPASAGASRKSDTKAVRARTWRTISRCTPMPRPWMMRSARKPRRRLPADILRPPTSHRAAERCAGRRRR